MPYRNNTPSLEPPPSRADKVLLEFATRTEPFAIDVKPVPPCATPISSPFQTPVVIVPKVVMDDCPT